MLCVIDTNVLISGFIIKDSTPAKAVRKARRAGNLILTQQTLEELISVINRPKFDRYILKGSREEFLSTLIGKADIVPVSRPIKACRDPADDKFLDAAVHGNATYIVTGDVDLLMLHPFMNVVILTPGDFLEKMDLGAGNAG